MYSQYPRYKNKNTETFLQIILAFLGVFKKLLHDQDATKGKMS